MLTYTLEYDHLVGTPPATTTVHDALTGQMQFTEGTSTVTSPSLYLGTCSTAGTCTPHTNISNLKLNVTLKGSAVPDQTVTATSATLK